LLAALCWPPSTTHPSTACFPPCRYEFKQAKSKGATGAKLLFKKRMFRETDETVTEPQFVNLSYIQAQHDYLQVRWCWGGVCRLVGCRNCTAVLIAAGALGWKRDCSRALRAEHQSMLSML